MHVPVQTPLFTSSYDDSSKKIGETIILSFVIQGVSGSPVGGEGCYGFVYSMQLKVSNTVIVSSVNSLSNLQLRRQISPMPITLFLSVRRH